MLVTIIGILGTLLPTILANRGIIGANTDTLITSLMGPITALIADFKAGNTKTENALAALGALAGVVAVLQANKTLPAAVLSEINDVDLDIQAALTAYVTAGAGYNPLAYAPIAEVA